MASEVDRKPAQLLGSESYEQWNEDTIDVPQGSMMRPVLLSDLGDGIEHNLSKFFMMQS